MTGPRHLLQQQPWVIEQERARHEEALYAHGEYGLIVILWDLADHERGYVQRCPVCYANYGKTADAYGQSANSNCLPCLGTTWEGGWKAKIVRPTLWEFTDEDQEESARGEVYRQNASVQFPWDFNAGLETYICRGDGTRWKIVEQPQGTYVRAGFGTPTMSVSNVALTSTRVVLQDESRVIYELAPLAPELNPILQALNRRYPVDLQDIEEIRAPIL